MDERELCPRRRPFRLEPTEQYGVEVGDLFAGSRDPASRTGALAGDIGDLWLPAATDEYEIFRPQQVLTVEEQPVDRNLVGSR